jgi:hypothetical protein
MSLLGAKLGASRGTHAATSGDVQPPSPQVSAPVHDAWRRWATARGSFA